MSSCFIYTSYSLVNEFLELWEPVHVKSLIFIQWHAFNEGSEMFVNTVTIEVLWKSSLDSFVKSWEIWTSITLHLSLKSVNLLWFSNVVWDQYGIVWDLSVHGGSLNNKTLVAWTINNIYGEVAIVFWWGFFLLFLLLLLILLVSTLIIWQWLSIEYNIKINHIR